MTVRGRGWVALWLALTLGVLAWVVARQTAAHVAATTLRERQADRTALEARRANLFRELREAHSRQQLIPRAESLGLRVPADSELMMLQVPRPVRR